MIPAIFLIAGHMRRSDAWRFRTACGAPGRAHLSLMSRTDLLVYALVMAMTLAAAAIGAVYTWLS